MAGKRLSAGVEEVVSAFCMANGIDRESVSVRMSKAGNIVIDDGTTDYVLDPLGTLTVTTPHAATKPKTRKSVQEAHPQQQPKGDQAANGTPTSRYLQENPTIPYTVIHAIKRDAARLGMFSDWQRGLIFGVSVTKRPNGQQLVISFAPTGGNQSMVAFPDIVIGRPYPPSEAARIKGPKDEIRILEHKMGTAPYVLTPVGERTIRDAFQMGICEIAQGIELPSEELMTREHRRFEGMGQFFAEELLRNDGTGKVPSLMLADEWNRHEGIAPGSPKAMRPWQVGCTAGRLRAFYDLHRRKIRFDPQQIDAAKSFVRRKAHAIEYDEVDEAVERRFPLNKAECVIVSDIDYRITVHDVCTAKGVIKMSEYSAEQLDAVLDEIEAKVLAGRKDAFGRWGDRLSLAGSLIPMAIMGLLVDNRLTEAGERLTEDDIVRVLKGWPHDMPSDLVVGDLAQAATGFSREDIMLAYEALRQDKLILLRNRNWNGFVYENPFPVTNTTREFMALGHAEAAEGTAPQAMTEWQLLSLLDGNPIERPFERLAEELPALLDHPACYYANPERFMAYVRALPDTLQDYVRVLPDLSVDEVQLGMLASVIAELDGGQQGDGVEGGTDGGMVGEMGDGTDDGMVDEMAEEMVETNELVEDEDGTGEGTDE